MKNSEALASPRWPEIIADRQSFTESRKNVTASDGLNSEQKLGAGGHRNIVHGGTISFRGRALLLGPLNGPLSRPACLANRADEREEGICFFGEDACKTPSRERSRLGGFSSISCADH